MAIIDLHQAATMVDVEESLDPETKFFLTADAVEEFLDVHLGDRWLVLEGHFRCHIKEVLAHVRDTLFFFGMFVQGDELSPAV